MDRYRDAEWLELSGLPAQLNQARVHGWGVFKKIVELDCRAHRDPGTVEVSLVELGERCGLPAGKVGRIIEVLRKKKYLRCFIPDNEHEEALIEIRVPVSTPRPPHEVARTSTDPYLRDPSVYRYVHETRDQPVDEKRVQQVADLYLNHVSQKMNAFIFEQLEIAAGRFPLDAIRRHMERAERHEVRSMGWVLKELVREREKRDTQRAKVDTAS